jgi:uncharacterized protein (DUF1810 family)
MTSAPGLERFIEAQRDVYASALAEIRAGTKHSHWMWFIFPQLAGLGHSATARFFAIHGKNEARGYLSHRLLGSRLAECTDAMLAWAGLRDAEIILGAVDALKFRSSMTLFETVSDSGGSNRFSYARDTFCNGERDGLTLRLLKPDSGPEMRSRPARGTI